MRIPAIEHFEQDVIDLLGIGYRSARICRGASPIATSLDLARLPAGKETLKLLKF
jgi:hypothetical protein